MSSTESGLKKNYLNINMIAKIAVMGALAGALMFFEFPLTFPPPFYKIDFSEVAVLISGFALGPLAAVLVEFIKIVVHLLIKGTTTLFVGELANFLIGCSFVVPAALIYKYHKNKRSALYGMVIGTLSMMLFGALVNAFILLPVYAWAYQMPMDALIAMGSELNANITGIFTFVIFATTPLNLIKGAACTVIVSLIYKRVSPLLKK